MLKLTSKDLKQILKDHKIKGYSKLRKPELIMMVERLAMTGNKKKGKSSFAYPDEKMKNQVIEKYRRGEGFFDNLKSLGSKIQQVAEKIPFGKIADASLQIAFEIAPEGTAKDILKISSDISRELIRDKKMIEKAKPIISRSAALDKKITMDNINYDNDDIRNIPLKKLEKALSSNQAISRRPKNAEKILLPNRKLEMVRPQAEKEFKYKMEKAEERAKRISKNKPPLNKKYKTSAQINKKGKGLLKEGNRIY